MTLDPPGSERTELRLTFKQKGLTKSKQGQASVAACILESARVMRRKGESAQSGVGGEVCVDMLPEYIESIHTYVCAY